MHDGKTPVNELSPRRRVYADMLKNGTRIGLIVTLILFAVYIFSVREPAVPFENLSRVWSQSAETLREAHGLAPGWAWLTLAGHGDYMALIGIALLCCVTLVCLARIIPFSIKSKDYIFLTFLVLEVLILLSAASGLLQGGH